MTVFPDYTAIVSGILHFKKDTTKWKNLNNLSSVKEPNLVIEISLSVSFIINGKNPVLFCMFHILINLCVNMLVHKSYLVFYFLELSCIAELCSYPVWYDQRGLEDFLLIRHAQKQEV